MILVDTSVWISFLRADDSDLSSVLKSHLKKGQIYSLSAVFGELFTGASNDREKKLLTDLWVHLPKINEAALFLAAGQLSNIHKLHVQGVGLIDCQILAAALENNLALWTHDEKLLSAFDFIQDSLETP